ncbi:MAG: biotin transporter BioY [Phototrophicaceae bacterium]
MLRTIQLTRTNNHALRLAAIAIFTLLMVISSKMSIEIGAVPFTMQVLVVFLSGMVLGSRDGAASQIAYISLIAANLPVDARGLGAAAFFGPTGGYLMGFAVAAFVIGWLVENSQDKVWQRFLAGIIGIAVIYTFGAIVLKIVTGMGWSAAWTNGVAPFIVADLIKALIAATLVEGTRSLLLMNSDLVQEEKPKN